jgi:hypothetical protein
MKMMWPCLALFAIACSQDHSVDGAASDGGPPGIDAWEDPEVLPGILRSRTVFSLSDAEWEQYCHALQEHYGAPPDERFELACPGSPDGVVVFYLPGCIMVGRSGVTASCPATIGALHDCEFGIVDNCRAGHGDVYPTVCMQAGCM